MNRYRPRHMPWGLGPWMGLVSQPRSHGVPGTPAFLTLVLTTVCAPSGWRVRKSGSLLSPERTLLCRSDGIGT